MRIKITIDTSSRFPTVFELRLDDDGEPRIRAMGAPVIDEDRSIGFSVPVDSHRAAETGQAYATLRVEALP